jgi:ATP-dependent RNA helicase RhlE
VGIIHSNKSQNYRFGSLRAFASGQCRILIATDLVARGLDITDVSHVVCFDIPQEAADFIHRIGRTGRADKNGVAIIFATDKEEEALAQVQALMQRQIPMLAIPNGVPHERSTYRRRKALHTRHSLYPNRCVENLARCLPREKR